MSKMNSKKSTVSFEQITNVLSLSHAAGHLPAQLKRQMDTVGLNIILFQTSFFLAPQGPKS